MCACYRNISTNLISIIPFDIILQREARAKEREARKKEREKRVRMEEMSRMVDEKLSGVVRKKQKN